MNVSTIPLLSQIGVTAVSAVTGFNPLARPQQTLRNVQKEKPGFSYVAFGDSLTTGSSIHTCRDDRKRSPWGCIENPTAAIPYPNRVANFLGYKHANSPIDYTAKNLKDNPIDLYRAGMWGYTVQEAANPVNSRGSWLSQLDAISQATELVTGSLGINDLHFSNVTKWAKLYLKPGQDRVTPAVKAEIAARDRDFDKLFKALTQAKNNGARVVIGLYYNPYDSNKPGCNDLKKIGNRIVNTLDNELLKRSRHAGFYVADFRPAFAGHGSGSDDSYVFGTECDIAGALKTLFPAWVSKKDVKKAIGVAFDPHPNNQGTEVMARKVWGTFYYAD